MKPWLYLKATELIAQRPEGADEDVHYPEALVEAVLEEFTGPGDLVLDPFAGFGTTLVVAERMGRRAIGVELLDERVDLIRGRLSGGDDVRVVQGDARNLSALVDGPIDLCMTSPPYMTATDHPENPLTAYETLDGDYVTYLAEIGDVFRQVAGLLRPGGHAVVNVANLEDDGYITPLAWDMGRVLCRHLVLRSETFLCWDALLPGLSGDYCLTYEKPPG
ncbi:TRM11 family SAM-dependent methyltransferase [Phytohabitans houttuyneae]|uniref:Methyltransferase n=1 Tax=Phytohabitans houttuyneae TaxID=1076126 RepID=A0A6V8KCN0_9ACTN|nr:DNA methyltransferase [Phytohabitans houttuyneae]GFJ79869.1 hypothetical protein Phou_040490 [Phytohabitans houttuyneae]